jgi:hypothetical protein
MTEFPQANFILSLTQTMQLLKFPPKGISFLPKYKENRHPNNLKYIKLEAVKTILGQFFKLVKDFHHFLMCLYSKTSTYLHVSNLILHTQQKNSREFQRST